MLQWLLCRLETAIYYFVITETVEDFQSQTYNICTFLANTSERKHIVFVQMYLQDSLPLHLLNVYQWYNNSTRVVSHLRGLNRVSHQMVSKQHMICVEYKTIVAISLASRL